MYVANPLSDTGPASASRIGRRSPGGRVATPMRVLRHATIHGRIVGVSRVRGGSAQVAAPVCRLRQTGGESALGRRPLPRLPASSDTVLGNRCAVRLRISDRRGDQAIQVPTTAVVCTGIRRTSPASDCRASRFDRCFAACAIALAASRGSRLQPGNRDLSSTSRAGGPADIEKCVPASCNATAVGFECEGAPPEPPTGFLDSRPRHGEARADSG